MIIIAMNYYDAIFIINPVFIVHRLNILQSSLPTKTKLTVRHIFFFILVFAIIFHVQNKKILISKRRIQDCVQFKEYFNIFSSLYLLVKVLKLPVATSNRVCEICLSENSSSQLIPVTALYINRELN